MASSISNPSSGPASNLPAYFNKLSKTYALETGNATLNLFATLVSHLAPITPNSIIHDNASGPGTATSVILANLPHGSECPKFIATDMVPAMIDAFRSCFPPHPKHTTKPAAKS
ncbi:uncharacterized protein RSE6_12614 [Rhynchosporium secalis]|uniref:Uncharacterized protein n=1 Tax=Rhynchosporium secalis TaxID=38038 RepID=A0A1E1MQU2_RHYSE|nr:uncharacterized protein RSE6_12614 [Rhynchosporium secalis]